MGKSKIEWTDATWNPAVGCTFVSPGCDHCYAAREASGRLSSHPLYAGLAHAGRFTGEVRLAPSRLSDPLRWREPRRIFVNSMSDLFHDGIPTDYIARVFAVMALAGDHSFQVLTKRPGRARSLLSSPGFVAVVARHAGTMLTTLKHPRRVYLPRDTWPLPHVWLGVSAEDQRWAQLRLPILMRTPAAVRWVSAEPLLGPLDLTPWLDLTAAQVVLQSGRREQLPRLDWVVAGGESGPAARPVHPAWVTHLNRQCIGAAVPFLLKQWGEWLPGEVYDAGPGVAFLPASRDVADPVWEWPGNDDHRAHRWPDGTAALRVGKKAAGRQLGGRTYDGYPG